MVTRRGFIAGTVAGLAAACLPVTFKDTRKRLTTLYVSGTRAASEAWRKRLGKSRNDPHHKFVVLDAKLSGRRADLIIVDDSVLSGDSAIDWYNSQVRTRLTPGGHIEHVWGHNFDVRSSI